MNCVFCTLVIVFLSSILPHNIHFYDLSPKIFPGYKRRVLYKMRNMLPYTTKSPWCFDCFRFQFTESVLFIGQLLANNSLISSLTLSTSLICYQLTPYHRISLIQEQGSDKQGRFFLVHVLDETSLCFKISLFLFWFTIV